MASYYVAFEVRATDFVEDLFEVYDSNTGKVIGIGDHIAAAKLMLDINRAFSDFVDRGGKVSL